MSKQKDKKIKRLHRKHVWPAVVSMFLFVLLFIFIILGALGLFMESIFSNKLGHAAENTQKAAQIIFDENISSEGELKQLEEEIQKTLPDVEDICIMSTDNQTLMKTGDAQPELENEILIVFPGIENRKLYLSGESDETLHIENGELRFDFGDVLEKLYAEKETETYTDRMLLQVNVWFVNESEENRQNIFVKNRIEIKESEMKSFIVFTAMTLILILVFFGYFIIFIIGLFRDQRKLTQLLYLDPVTGGNNWTYLKAKGERFIKKIKHNRIKYALVHVKMNKYQSFCTCYGVKEGNELLELIYTVLQQCIGKKEVAVHYARADYAMLLKYDTKEALEKRLENILVELGAIRPGQRLEFNMGVYEINDIHTDIDAMYNNSSIARSSLNEDGEKKICWYSEEMQKQQLWERTVEDKMEKALICKEFHVYLQPKYSPKEEVLSGAEALVRWISPEEGFIPPNRFIPIFEKNGFILKLDDYMISEVARQQAQWISEGKKVVPISVNVSRAHFTQDDLAEHICRLVDQYNVPHEVIELELTESAFFEDKEVLLGTVRKLRGYGFTVSMDDFGAGYSSLNSLKELPLDVIKLDAEFFRGADDTGKGKIIVNETIDLAKKLDMRTVAEGIETKEQVDFLADLGCDLIQGYYFAKPMPIQEFEQKAFAINKE